MKFFVILNIASEEKGQSNSKNDFKYSFLVEFVKRTWDY